MSKLAVDYSADEEKWDARFLACRAPGSPDWPHKRKEKEKKNKKGNKGRRGKKRRPSASNTKAGKIADAKASDSSQMASNKEAEEKDQKSEEGKYTFGFEITLETPMHEAAYKGDVEWIKRILAETEIPPSERDWFNFQTSRGHTPLFLVNSYKDYCTVSYIIYETYNLFVCLHGLLTTGSG